MSMSLRVRHGLDLQYQLSLLLVELNPLIPELYLSVHSVRNGTPESVACGVEPTSDVVPLITVSETIQWHHSLVMLRGNHRHQFRPQLGEEDMVDLQHQVLVVEADLVSSEKLPDQGDPNLALFLLRGGMRTEMCKMSL